MKLSHIRTIIISPALGFLFIFASACCNFSFLSFLGVFLSSSFPICYRAELRPFPFSPKPKAPQAGSTSCLSGS